MRQLASTTAMATLQPSSFALATPAAIIFRLASSVSRWVGTKSGMALSLSSLPDWSRQSNPLVKNINPRVKPALTKWSGRSV